MTAETGVRRIGADVPAGAGFAHFGSINFALFPQLSRYKEWKFRGSPIYRMDEDFIFPTPSKTLKEFCTFFREADQTRDRDL